MEFTGKTVEEAIQLGLKELGITEEMAEIQVKEQPTKGLFGIMKGKAVVEIEKKQAPNTPASFIFFSNAVQWSNCFFIFNSTAIKKIISIVEAPIIHSKMLKSKVYIDSK